MDAIKILILDDDHIDAEIMQDVLTEEIPASEFRLAETKEDFQAILSQFHPDLILSDNSMPRFSSTEALAMARSMYPGIPFIVVAGIAPEEFVIEIMKLGADDYISKDKLKELPAAIAKVMKLHKASKERAEVAAQLEISEKNYHTVFLKSPLPKWIFDIETMKFLEVNEAAVGQYGYSREEFLKMELRNIRPEEDVEKLLRFVTVPRSFDDKQPTIWQHTKKNGQVIDVEIYSHPITYNNRTARMAIVNDITERTKAQQRLEQSEANLKSIFDNTSEGFLLLDKNASIMAFNSNAEKYNLFSQTEKFQVGKSVYDYVTEAHKAYFQNVLDKAMSGVEFKYDRFYTLDNGSIHWIEFSVTPVFTDDEVKGVCFTGHDITDKKRAEQEREFDRNNLKALINNTKDLMWSIDRNFGLITSNEAFNKVVENLYGSRLEKGSNLMEIQFNPEQREHFMAYYERVFSGESFTETERMAKDFWADISFYPIYTGEVIIGAACFSRNITWQKKAERERMEYAQSLEEMLFKISHQLRVPIANLLGIAHVIEISDESDKDTKDIVGLITPTVSTLDTFSRDLAQFIETILLKRGHLNPTHKNKHLK
jgi:PAS domain S-box-containing protein